MDLSCNCRSFDRQGIGLGVVIKDFTKQLTPLKIAALGDIHGNSSSFKILTDKCEEIKEINGRILITGDLLDNRVKDSISFEHGSKSPAQEIDTIERFLKNYAPHIDAVVGGNHDMRTYKHAGEDVLRRICMNNNIPYHPDGMVIIYKIGKQKNYSRNAIGRRDGGPVVYKIFLSHSARCGRKEGGKLQKVVDFKNIIDADIFLAGHSHDLSSHRGAGITISHQGVLRMKEQVFINCGSYQPYVGYMANKNMTPCPQGCAILELNPRRHKVEFQI